MNRIRNILVVVQPSESARSGLEKAMKLALRFGAAVELYLCDAERAFALRHEYEAHGVERVRQSCMKESRQYLQNLLASVDSSGVSVSIDAGCDSPEYAAISQKVLSTRPDLVIRNIGRRRPLEAPSLGENDWNLIRSCPAPLLLVRETAWVRCPNVVAAVDISSEEAPELTRIILQTANYLSAGCDADLEVVYCAPRAETVDADRRELHKQVEFAAVPPAVVEVIAGEPAQALPTFVAGTACDIVVLGALTHQKSFAALVGTLTSRLLETAHCDFLLVKSPTYTRDLVRTQNTAQTAQAGQ